MDSSDQERKRFGRLKCIIGSAEEDITFSGLLSQETIEQTEAEVDRLKKLKASRMKEFVLKRRSELEEICRRAHIEPDMTTAPDKTNALIDSGLVDPSELLANIEAQIVKAKEKSMIRKDIMDKISKWLAACDEETWLEEYNQDQNRYSAGRGVHLNLKRAEKARITVSKIPAIVDSLINGTFTWENERNMPFMYDGVRLVSILEEYKLTRQQKEEEKRRYRDQKKLQNLLLTEKEARFGSKPSPRSNSFNRKSIGYHANGNGFMTPIPRRLSVGSATPELLTPRSYSGRYNGYFKETRRLSTTPLNFVSLSKDDTLSTFTSVSGSEPESPQQL
ncbi:putative 65-kDa microtubule-associated protein 6 [Cocos nucifera]|nr:putative 65-kDa microtubule-associated protein 6 [Cocos nucifera]